jgi:hypothetical protein
MRVRYDGNVGIGTTNPGYGLTITTAPANATGRTLEVAPSMSGTAGTGECVSRMYFTDSGITECGIRVGVKNVSSPGNLSYPLQAYYNGTAVLSVTSTSNVGIGTTSPTKPLVVNRVAAGGSNNPAIMIGNNGVISGLRFQTYDLVADPAAFMGLGTDMGIGSYEHSLVFPVGGTAGKQTIGSYDGTTYSTKMTILNNGNVGIGTTTPGYTLDVNGSMNVATVSSTTGLMFRNRIINGTMNVNQRGPSNTAVNNPGGAWLYGSLDRWFTIGIIASKFSIQQNTSVVPNSSFTNSLLITSLSAYTTTGAGDYFGFGQFIEGYNISDLAWGTSSASPVTISFWVRSSLTGTFALSLEAQTYTPSYVTTYTINVANTWEQKVLVITPPTSGSFNSTNGCGIRVWWDLGSGTNYNTTVNTWAAGDKIRVSSSINFLGTNGATLYLTGVQFEKGSIATPFEYRPFPIELQMCQRYFETSYDSGTAVGTATIAKSCHIRSTATTSQVYFVVPMVYYKVTKRTVPTITIYNASTGAIGTWYVDSSGGGGGNPAAVASADTNGNDTYGFFAYTNSSFQYYQGNGIFFHWTSDIEYYGN